MRNEEQVANDWLKQNGIAIKHMDKMDLCLQQAQMVATNLLKHHAEWLSSEERNLLTTYIKTVHIRARQNKACRAIAYKVLNLGKRMNRMLFRQFKATNANKSLR
jgi:predicted phosphoadenosine phosphosulfate sulfurtransferase